MLDQSTSNINRYNSDGTFDTLFAQFPLFQPIDLEFGPDGKLYVLGSDQLSGDGQILRFAADGVLFSGGLTNPRFLVFAIPEPSTLGLIGSALLLLAARRRRRMRDC